MLDHVWCSQVMLISKPWRHHPVHHFARPQQVGRLQVQTQTTKHSQLRGTKFVAHNYGVRTRCKTSKGRAVSWSSEVTVSVYVKIN